VAGRGGFPYRPGAYDDTFEDANTIANRWTFTGVGGLIFKDVNTTVPYSLYLQAFALQPAPAPPFTIRAKCVAITWDGGSTPGVGNSSIAIAQAAPGPYYYVGIDVGIVGKMDLTSSNFDSGGHFNSNFPTLPSANQVTGAGYQVPHVIEVTVHSATNIDARISFDDGLTWTTIMTGHNPGVTPNYIGLANGGSQGTWAWFRVT
jgi:hypothetical protein